MMLFVIGNHNRSEMRVLILGGDGMLGHKVFQILSEGFETFATFRELRGLWTNFPMYEDINPKQAISGIDVLDSDSMSHAFAQVKPDIVINCIGIIKQRKEAKDPILSLTLNSLFPHQLAELCHLAEARLFHISTDCVFSGRKGNYSEDDESDAEDLYGKTKYLGEIDREGCLTIRTSIIGREFIRRTGLLEWFISNHGGTVNGYINTIFSGLTTQALARIMGDLILHYPNLSGVYQIASTPISKFDLLSKINKVPDLGIDIIPDEKLKCDRSLNPAKFLRDTNCVIPDWDTMISDLAADPTPYDDWRNK